MLNETRANYAFYGGWLMFHNCFSMLLLKNDFIFENLAHFSHFCCSSQESFTFSAQRESFVFIMDLKCSKGEDKRGE